MCGDRVRGTVDPKGERGVVSAGDRQGRPLIDARYRRHGGKPVDPPGDINTHRGQSDPRWPAAGEERNDLGEVQVW